MFPLVKTSFSNLSLVMLARLGLRTSPAVLNMRSTAAELGKAVLYLMNSEIHFSLCMLGNCFFRARPLSNSSDTVVVVGGVHWLAAQHLHMLTATLQREGLEGAVVVVKTTGAGFHVAAPGVHTVSRKDHARLLQHSLHLAAAARSHGYLVLDTFNMTAARYQHFLQGKCACHFHKVSEHKNIRK
ncbi:Cadherin-like and PC-esterase domain-containing protein 1 [Chionoecetes opilio]|uniref:Cadherin-like and PC-esterase domain-containing protein 1 n=1 Tax=Chionoecetes opilio TaxID=41210 RepID=A0A8J5BTG9_CHIOP|nr:Cadherin-like and PC-esterase domain-containing protein 1 [Chionoecetes opilio]